MKKQIISLLLAVVLACTLLPFSVAAEEHDLKILKNGEPAAEDVDYTWSGNILRLISNGLTVTGTTEKERIILGATLVTFKDLSIDTNAGKNSCIYSAEAGDYVIDIEGKVMLKASAPGIYIKNDAGNLTLTGKGTLEGDILQSDILAVKLGSITVRDSVKIKAKSTIYSVIWAYKDITFDTTGAIDITTIGGSAIGSDTGRLIITDKVPSFTARGFIEGEDGYELGESGAVEFYAEDPFVLPEGKAFVGAADVNAEAKDIAIVTTTAKVPEHTDGWNAYTAFIDENTLAGTVVLGGVTKLEIPAGKHCTYVVKDSATGTELGAEPTEAGTLKVNAAIGRKISITAIPDEGHDVKGTNPYVSEAVTAKTAIDPSALPYGAHKLEKVDGKPATEEEAGYEDYYECKGSDNACHMLFEDAEGKTEIADIEAWKAEDGNGYLPKLKETSQTSDMSSTALWIVLAIVSVAGIVSCLACARKKRA